MRVTLDQLLEEEPLDDDAYLTNYHQCMLNSYQNKDFCSQTYGKRQFEIFQYALFDFYFKT